MDDRLQVQRMAFDEAGMGAQWIGLDGSIPITKEKEAVFGICMVLTLWRRGCESNGRRRKPLMKQLSALRHQYLRTALASA